MFAILVYDIPSDEAGLKRRNRIYKKCSLYGYHVQNSVFEFDIEYSRLITLEHELSKVINCCEDSVRVYLLGKNRTDAKVHLLGRREFLESDDDSFIV